MMGKRLILIGLLLTVALLLIACPASATITESHTAESLDEQTTVGTTDVYACNLTFTPATEGNYLILAFADVNGNLTMPRASLWVDGTAVAKMGGILKSVDDYTGFCSIENASLSAAEHTISIAFNSTNTSSMTKIRNARIIAIRLDGTEYYGEHDTLTQGGKYKGWTGTINLAGDTDYIIIATAQLSGNPAYIRVNDSVGAGTLYSDSTLKPYTSSQHQLYSWGMVRKVTLGTGNHNLSLETANAICAWGKIIAIPASSFSQVTYSESEATDSPVGAGTWYEKTNVGGSMGAYNYLALASMNGRSDSATQTAFVTMSLTDYTTGNNNYTLTDAFANSNCFSQLMGRHVSYASGTKSITQSYMSTSTGADFNQSRAIILQLGDAGEPTPSVTFTAASYEANETAGNITVNLTISQQANETVNYTFTNGTALNSVNYTASSGSFVFTSSGATYATLNVSITNDAFDNGDKYFYLNLTSADNSSTFGSYRNVTLWIRDDDEPPTINLGSATYTVDEDVGVGYVVITITRSGNTTPTVYANLSTCDGTAVSGGVLGNYTAATSQWVFASGETEKLAIVAITNDTFYGGNKYFFVNLTTTNATFGSPRNATVTILDDETPPLLANFTADATTGTGFKLVNFTDESVGDIVAWAWNFGDGGENSTTQNPYRLFMPGTYDVMLTVTDGTGNTSTMLKENYITIQVQAPTAHIIVSDTTVTVGTLVSFDGFTSSTGSSPFTYAWSFGTGSGIANSTDFNPSVTYTKNGTYTVILTLTNSAGSDSDTVQITVSNATATVSGDFMQWYNDAAKTFWPTIMKLIFVLTCVALILIALSRLMNRGGDMSGKEVVIAIAALAFIIISLIFISYLLNIFTAL